MAENTFLGLQPYTEADAYRFKGRTEESQELFRLIVRNDYTVCYAESGEGKTSLLNAGVFPLLRQNMYFPIAITFTSDDYQYTPDSFDTIIDRCIKDSIADYNEKNKGINIEYKLCSTDFQDTDCQLALQQELSKYSWWKLRNYKPQAMGLTFTPVFVFDQFEEVFSLPGSIVWTKKFFDWLEDMSSDSCPDEIVNKVREIIGANAAFPAIKEEKDFKAVFSLRKEFIGELDYWGMQKCFIPSLKDNRYCLKSLTYEGAKKVMTQQQRFEETKVEQVLHYFVQQYSREPEKTIAENLPVVPALLLSVVCDSWEKDIYYFSDIDDNGVDQSLNKILEKFYDETIGSVINDLSQQESNSQTEPIRKDIETAIFALVDTNGKRVRRKSSELSHLDFDAKYKELIGSKRIIKISKVDGEDYVEIVHDALCPIIAKRKEQRLAEEAKERERVLNKRNRQILISSFSFFALLALLFAILWDGIYHDIEVHYGIVIKRNGWYEGLERISEKEASYRSCHYVLKYHGRWNKHPYAMEARNGYGELTTNHDIKTYIVDQYEEADTGVDSVMFELLKSTCQWEFVRNESGLFVVQERYLNKEGNLIVANNRALTNDNKVINTYVDDYGFPLLLRDSIYFYVRTSYDENGYESLIEFFDDQGMPIVNKDSVYQIKKEYLSNGIIKSEYGCFFDGRPTLSKDNNSGYNVTKYTADSLRCTEWVFIDDDLKNCKPSNDVPAMEKREYDTHGRVTKISYWNELGSPYSIGHVHSICIEYNEHGQIIRKYYQDSNSEKCFNADSMYEVHYQYDQFGNETKREEFYSNQTDVFCNEYLKNGTLIKQELFSISSKGDVEVPLNAKDDTLYTNRYYYNVEEGKELYMNDEYSARVEKDSHGNPTRISFFDSQNKRPIEYDGYHENRIKYDYQGTTTNYTDSYYSIDGKLTNPSGWKYSMLKVTIDSIKMSQTCMEYNKEGKYLTGYRNYCDDNHFLHVIIQESINEQGKTIRTYNNNLFYYRKRMLFSIKPSISMEPIGWFAEGEFGAPSLVFQDDVSIEAKNNNSSSVFKDVDMSKNGNILDTDENLDFVSRLCSLFDISTKYSYYATCNYKGQDFYFNEHGQRINPGTDNWQVVPYVEVLQPDSTFGFHDGDIVLACNEWKLNIEKSNIVNLPWQKKSSRVFIIARVNNKNTAYEKKLIELSANTNIGSYVRFKKMRCTSYEIKEMTPLLDR